MTIKLRCTVCEEITEHDVLKRYGEYIESGIVDGRLGHNTTKLIYKCIKCGRERKMLDVFLEWMRGWEKIISSIMPMYNLTVEGIEEAMDYLRAGGKNQYKTIQMLKGLAY